jgi:2-oxoglutarate dehydrogenase E2 component (dihydrolipoamide succinyltransferase)
VILADTEGEERLAVRLMAYLALTYDHRLIDGADAARYLATVKRRLERPDAYVGVEP